MPIKVENDFAYEFIIKNLRAKFAAHFRTGTGNINETGRKNIRGDHIGNDNMVAFVYLVQGG